MVSTVPDDKERFGVVVGGLVSLLANFIQQRHAVFKGHPLVVQRAQQLAGLVLGLVVHTPTRVHIHAQVVVTQSREATLGLFTRLPAAAVAAVQQQQVSEGSRAALAW